MSVSIIGVMTSFTNRGRIFVIRPVLTSSPGRFTVASMAMFMFMFFVAMFVLVLVFVGVNVVVVVMMVRVVGVIRTSVPS